MTFKTVGRSALGRLGEKGDIEVRAHNTVGPTSPRQRTTLANNVLGRYYLFGILEKQNKKEQRVLREMIVPSSEVATIPKSTCGVRAC